MYFRHHAKVNYLASLQVSVGLYASGWPEKMVI